MQIHISLSGDRVHLRTAWYPGAPDDAKSIPGARWSDKQQAWTYPLSMATCRSMRKVYGSDLVVHPDLAAWARAEVRKEKKLKMLSRRSDTRLSHVQEIAPVLAQAMGDRTYQRVAARFAANAGSFLLADEPGLGKTATSLAALMEAQLWRGDHLIIAPKSSLSATWGDQIARWVGAGAVAAPVPEGAVKRRAFVEAFMRSHSGTQPRFLIVNPAMLRRVYGHICSKCGIWDEDVKKKKIISRKEAGRIVKTPIVWPIEHTLESHTTKRVIREQDWPEILDKEWVTVIVDESHDLLTGYTPSNITQATRGLLDIKSEQRYALTGTPLRGEERKIWGHLDWLGAKTGGYWNFVDSYFEVSKGYFGSEILGLQPDKQKDFHLLIDRFVLRRTRAEVRKDLPLGKRYDIMVEMDDKHAAQYEEFRALGEVELESGAISSQGVLSELTRLKQVAFGRWTNDGSGHLKPTGNSPKLDYLYDFLKERGIVGKRGNWYPEKGAAYKYVVGSQYTEILDVMEQHLNTHGIPTLKITGSVTGKHRTAAQRLFQSDDKEFRVMLIQTKTGGVSIDLDAWCDEMIIMDETFVADEQVQLEGRINNRSGRVSPRSWYYLRTAGTIDQKIAESNYSQLDLQHRLLDKRRGVETALHLVRR